MERQLDKKKAQSLVAVMLSTCVLIAGLAILIVR
jgi:hypothetical protein